MVGQLAPNRLVLLPGRSGKDVRRQVGHDGIWLAPSHRRLVLSKIGPTYKLPVGIARSGGRLSLENLGATWRPLFFDQAEDRSFEEERPSAAQRLNNRRDRRSWNAAW